MPDSDLAGAHVAGQAGESQATPDIPPEVDDEALAALLLEIMNRGTQCAPKSHPHGTGKVRDLEKSDFRPHLRVNRALRFDYRRTLLRPFAPRYFNHNFFLTTITKLAN